MNEGGERKRKVTIQDFLQVERERHQKIKKKYSGHEK